MLCSSTVRLNVRLVVPKPVLNTDSRLGSILVLQVCLDPSDTLQFANVVLDSGPKIIMLSFVNNTSCFKVLRSVSDILVVSDNVIAPSVFSSAATKALTSALSER
eukprot:11588942-Heterocapsa_arctica.AAC.1